MQLGTGIIVFPSLFFFFQMFLKAATLFLKLKKEVRVCNTQKQKGSGFQSLRSAELVKAEETKVSPTPLPPGNC